MNTSKEESTCPAQGLLKILGGKWKPEIFRLAAEGRVRFSDLLRHCKGANRQSLSVALRELEAADLLVRTVVQQKPLHVEYELSNKARQLLPVFYQLESIV
jgi:DNA-binding HxlR family transcriptional regulator